MSASVQILNEASTSNNHGEKAKLPTKTSPRATIANKNDRVNPVAFTDFPLGKWWRQQGSAALLNMKVMPV